MATNKHATIRYQALDKCFRNPGRRYYIDDLLDACSQSIYEYTGNDNGVKRRQLLDDIAFMESPQGWNIPLEHIRDGRKVYYRYEDANFSINNQPLNETEERQLKDTLLTLSRFKGMPHFEWIDELITRLDAGLGLSRTNEPIIEFEQNEFLRGLEYITPLYNRILYRKVVLIEYKSFKNEQVQHITLHPYFLKQYKNRWFLFGWNNDWNTLTNIALDRILSLADTQIAYIPNNKIDFQEYFDDVIGVTVDKDAKLEKVRITIHQNLYPYVETKPMHGSQKVIERLGTHTIVQLEVIPNYELESQLLSYGEGVQILSPEWLRQKIKNRIEQQFKNYL